MQRKNRKLKWSQFGVPISTCFDDPYYSLNNGLAETRYVFLNGNNLPKRFCPNFHIAELGFGTGLNFLATLAAWQNSKTCGQLYFTSFEAFPLTVDIMKKALSLFPELSTLSNLLLDQWHPDKRYFEFDSVSLNVIIGDARQTIPLWKGIVDAWYLDGFLPAKNPQLWELDLIKHVFQKTKSGGTFATYSAAGFVKRNLKIAGFKIEICPGYGKKRHMILGQK